MIEPCDSSAPAASSLPDPADPSRPRLTLLTKLTYGVGSIGLIMKATLFGIFTLYLYTTVMGLRSEWVGLASALCLLWDAFIDPYIGHRSDHGTSPFGRRHAPMLGGGLLMGVSFWAYMAPPPGLSEAGLFGWLMVTSLLVRTTMSLFSVPYLALGAELSNDYHERTSITAIRGLLSLVGGLAASTLSFVIFLPDRVPGVDPKLHYPGYPAMGLAFGAIMTLCALVSTFGTLGWRPHLARAEALPSAESSTMRSRFVATLQNRSFRCLTLSAASFFIALVLSNSILLYFMTYQAGIIQSGALSLFQVASFLGGSLGVILGLRVTRRIEKRTIYLGSAVATAAIMAGAYLTIGPGRLFGTGNVSIVLIGAFLAGLFSSPVLFVPHSMLADVVDEDERVSGRRREGLYFGVFSLSQQFATGLALVLGGVLLGRFAGLVSGQAEQTAETAVRVAMLYGVLPAGLLILAGILLLPYPLNRREVAEIQQELDQRRRLRHPNDGARRG